MADEIKAEADVTEAELTPEQLAEAEELAGFQAAIKGEDLPVTEETAEEKEKVEGESEVKAEGELEKKEDVKTEPQLATITKAQFDELVAQVGGLKELKEGLEKLRGDAFGKLGGLERLIKQAEATQTSELDLDLKDEDFAEVNEEVPMLTGPLKKLVNKIVKAKVKVPAGSQAIDVEALRTQFKQEADAAAQARSVEVWKQMQIELLTAKHDDWIEVKETPEFKTWLAAEDKTTPGYQNMFDNSWNARELGGIFTKFKAHQEAEKAKRETPPAKKVVRTPSRNERLKEALSPKASSSTPPPKRPQTEEEAFAAVG